MLSKAGGTCASRSPDWVCGHTSMWFPPLQGHGRAGRPRPKPRPASLTLRRAAGWPSSVSTGRGTSVAQTLFRGQQRPAGLDRLNPRREKDALGEVDTAGQAGHSHSAGLAGGFSGGSLVTQWAFSGRRERWGARDMVGLSLVLALQEGTVVSFPRLQGRITPCFTGMLHK